MTLTTGVSELGGDQNIVAHDRMIRANKMNQYAVSASQTRNKFRRP